MTASIPIDKHQSVKFGFSNGSYVIYIYGGDYKTVTVAWQYLWLGTKFK